MKYIRRYSTLNDYIKDFMGIKGLPTHLSLVEDNDNMIGGELSKKTIFLKSKSDSAWVGDILCWNKSTNDWEILNVLHTYTENGNTYDKLSFDSWDENLVPDAICVIPACHTDNNKARWMALSSISSSQWSKTSTLVDGLSLYTNIPAVDHNDSDNMDYVCEHNKFSDYISTTTYNYAYISTEININSNSVYTYNLSEYLIDAGKSIMEGTLKDPYEGNILSIQFYKNGIGTLNLYNKTDDNYLLLKNADMFKYKDSDNNLNPICDLNGSENTNILIANGIDNFPATKTCTTYSTTYSPAGTWYLPSIGELCYIFARYYTIRQTIGMIGNLNINGVSNPYKAYALSAYINILTSTQYNAENVWGINTMSGMIITMSKTNTGCYVVPFKQY